jgi:hypothetical protein
VSDKGPKHYQQDRRTIVTDMRKQMHGGQVGHRAPGIGWADLASLLARQALPGTRYGFFAVYDGHGGHHMSEVAAHSRHTARTAPYRARAHVDVRVSSTCARTFTQCCWRSW